MKRKRQDVLNNRQIEILYSLAVNGIKNKSQLSREFGVKYPSIIGTVKILEDKNLVKVSTTEKGRGKERLFYELTDNGVIELSKNSQISLEKFWKIAFLIFDLKTNSNVKLSVQEFFSNYERIILGYNLEYTPIKWSIVLDAFNVLYKSKTLTPRISLLHILGSNGSMSKQEILKELRKKKTKTNYEEVLDNAIRDNFIMRFKKGKSIKYRISILGFLLLMNYLEHSKSDVLDRKEHIRFGYNIKQIIKNSGNTLPFISESWKELREIIDELNVVQFFKFIANASIPISNSIQIGGIKELLVYERIMSETNKHIIEKECRIGFEVLQKLFNERKYPEGQPSQVYNRLLFLSILSGYSVVNQENFLKSVKGSGFSLDLAIEKSISNKICFEFFTYFLDWVIMDKSRSKQLEDNLGKFYQAKVEKWNNFQKNNRKFRIWYQTWIEEIRKFEEKNLKILKEKDFLTV